MVFQHDHKPHFYAMSLHNLGSVHFALGQLGPADDAVSSFEEAIDRLDEALKYRQRETEPGNWALTYAARGVAKSLLAVKLGDAAHAQEGNAHISEAVKVIQDTNHSHYRRLIAEMIPVAEAIVARLSRKSNGSA